MKVKLNEAITFLQVVNGGVERVEVKAGEYTMELRPNPLVTQNGGQWYIFTDPGIEICCDLQDKTIGASEVWVGDQIRNNKMTML